MQLHAADRGGSSWAVSVTNRPETERVSGSARAEAQRQPPPPRIQIETPGAVSTAAATRQAHASATPSTVARRHLPRRPRRPARGRPYRRARRRATGARARCAASTPTSTATAGRATFPVDAARPLGVDDRGLDRRVRLLARRARRKVDAGQEDLAGELSEGACCSSRPPRAPRATDRSAIERALTALEDADADERQARRRARPRALRGRRALPRPQRRDDDATPRCTSTSTASARASAPGTSSSRAPGAASRASREQLPRARRARLRRPLPAADPPDRRDEPQGPQQRADRRPGRPRLAVGDRRREPAATTAIHPELGTIEDFDALVATAPRARHRHRARLRDPVLAPTTRG